jgi:DNA polymerase delta subunit 1
MIELTKSEVESHFTVSNGYAFDAKVIYGDTDSVMIKFGPEKLEDVMKLGRDASAFVTAKFVRPLSLEFEKCYFPYLLINKKRYAGLYWTRLENFDKLDTKGLETVRRDNCRLVQTVVDKCLRLILIDRDIEAAKEYIFPSLTVGTRNL